MTSDPLARSLQAFAGLLRGRRARRRILDEIEDHMIEAARSERAAGVGAEEAEARAVARFGDPTAVADAFPSSRWRMLAAAGALAALVLLVNTVWTTNEAQMRTCPGGKCPSWIPRPPQHPVRVRAYTAAAGAAAILTVGFAISAALHRRRAMRAYRRVLAGSVGRSSTEGLGESSPAVRWAVRLASTALATAALAGLGLAAASTIDGPPAVGVHVPAFRPALLGHRPAQLIGDRRAWPLLRRILRMMPSDFLTVGVIPGRGLEITDPAWRNYPRGTDDPGVVVVDWESGMLATAYGAIAPSVSAPRVQSFNTGFVEGGVCCPPDRPADPHGLRARLVAKLRLFGLQPVRVSVSELGSPLVVIVAKTSDPQQAAERPPDVFGGHILGGLLVIEDMGGAVRMIYAERGVTPNIPEVWVDPRLLPAQPEPSLRPHPRRTPPTSPPAPAPGGGRPA